MSDLEMISSGSDHGRATSDGKDAKTFLGFTAAAVLLWGVFYAGVSPRLHLEIAAASVVGGIGGYLLLALLRRLLGRIRGMRLRASYLAFSILFAAPVLLSALDGFSNRRNLDLITARDIRGILIVPLLSLLVVFVYQLIPRLIESRFRRAELPLFILVACISLFAPGFLEPSAAKGKRVDRVERYEVLNRVNADRTGERGGRVAVLGIDGATWNVIIPLMKRGKLPNLQRLMEGGSSGELLSDEFARSPVVWTTIFSGFPPEVHGVDQWETALSTNRRVKALWNVFNEYGRTSIVMNVPGSFPPEQVQGSMISGFPIPMVTLNNVGWVFSTDTPGDVDVPRGTLSFEPASVGGFAQRAEMRIPITLPAEAGSVVERPAMMYGDRLSVHQFLAEFLITRKLRKSGGAHELRLYLFKGENGDAVHLSLSANGAPNAASLEPGRWSPAIDYRLGQHQFFFKVKQMESTAGNVRIYVSPLYRPVFGSEIPFTFPLTPEQFPAAFPGHYVIEGPGWGELENEQLTQAFWELQRDIAATQSDYLDALFRHGTWDLFAAVYTLTDRIQHSLWKFREPELFGSVPGGLVDRFGPIIDQVYEEVDRRIGALLDALREDDLVVVLSDHGFQAKLPSLAQKSNQSGTHKKEGIFIFYGHNVKKSDEPAQEIRLQAGLLQVVPTILYLSGLPVGEDMKGKILTAIIDDDYLRDEPVRTIVTYNVAMDEAKAAGEIDESTKEQLKSLGYVQ
jgi:predicted AlkP superfamily phosphohydrolase/phosphomutase